MARSKHALDCCLREPTSPRRDVTRQSKDSVLLIRAHARIVTADALRSAGRNPMSMLTQSVEFGSCPHCLMSENWCVDSVDHGHLVAATQPEARRYYSASNANMDRNQRDHESSHSA